MSNVIEGYFGPKKTLRMKAVAYQRDLKATEHLGYEEKFAALLDLCDHAASGAFEVVIIAYPEILGDSEEELIRNLSLLSDTGLLLVVAQKDVVSSTNDPQITTHDGALQNRKPLRPFSLVTLLK